MNLKGFNGDNLTYNAREFLLQPSIGKNNDKEYFINFKLSIWNSGYASIIQEHEIIDISANELSENGLSLIYNSYKLPLALHMENNDLFGIYEIDDNISNYDLNKMYAKAISNFIGKELDISDMASTLLLMDYDFKPKNMGDKNLIYQKSMCNLISSPIFKYNELSTDQRNKLVKNNSYVLNNYNEIYVSTNPKVIINSIGANENNLPNHNTVEIYDRVLLQGIIPAIEIVMLDKFIYKRIYNLLNKNISKLTIEELEEIEEEIYKYNVMLNELKTYNFDTLTKLVKFIEDTQTAGITKEYIINSIDDFNKIIKSKKQRRRDESNRIISIFVSVLTLLLSYTYIYDIINIVNDTFVINFDKLSIFVYH